MKLLWRIALYLLGQKAKNGAKSAIKRRGVLLYLRAINGTRRGMVLAMLAFLFLQLMILAFVGAVVTGLLLFDADYELKLRVLFGTFLALFLLPAGALAVLFSERFWFKHSGARRMVDDLDR